MPWHKPSWCADHEGDMTREGILPSHIIRSPSSSAPTTLPNIRPRCVANLFGSRSMVDPVRLRIRLSRSAGVARCSPEIQTSVNCESIDLAELRFGEVEVVECSEAVCNLGPSAGTDHR